jgi:hypothetical protein
LPCGPGLPQAERFFLCPEYVINDVRNVKFSRLWEVDDSAGHYDRTAQRVGLEIGRCERKLLRHGVRPTDHTRHAIVAIKYGCVGFNHNPIKVVQLL